MARQHIVIIAGLATISGDNLSSHTVVGFQKHFNSGRICRFCMASHENIGIHCSEIDFNIRTQEVHDYHLRAVSEDENTILKFMVFFGTVYSPSYPISRLQILFHRISCMIYSKECFLMLFMKYCDQLCTQIK